MMFFEKDFYLHFLWAFLLLFFLFIWKDYRHGRKLAQTGTQISLTGGSKKRRTFLRIFRSSLLISSICLIIFAMANPQREVLSSGHSVSDPEIVFAVDVSNSMMAEDVAPSRLIRAQAFLLELSEHFRNEACAVLVFAGRAYPYVPLTKDYNFLRTAFKNLSTTLVHRQGTSLSEALKLSGSFFTKGAKKRIVVLLSDGESHEENYRAVSDSLRQQGIKIFIIGAGTKEGSYVPVYGTSEYKRDKSGNYVVSRLNAENLTTLAGPESGYVNIEDREKATSLLLNEFRRSGSQQVQQKIKAGYYHYLTIVALILLILEFLVPSGIDFKR